MLQNKGGSGWVHTSMHRGKLLIIHTRTTSKCKRLENGSKMENRDWNRGRQRITSRLWMNNEKWKASTAAAAEGVKMKGRSPAGLIGCVVVAL
jgi:hypothetical protein